MTKTRTLVLTATLMLGSLAFAAQKSQTYTGEIMDSACAKTGSHEGMMKTHPNMKTAKDCTQSCVKAGSSYVLYDSASKTAYQLDDQQMPERYAGKEVTVTGKLDPATHTIHLENIKAGSRG